MARRQMVTRAVEKRSALVVMMEDETYQVSTPIIPLPAELAESKIEKYCREHTPSGWAFVKVKEVYTDTKLYGMYLEDFMAYAMELTDDRKVVK